MRAAMTDTTKLAREWSELLDGNHVIIPAPVVTRLQIVQLANAHLALLAQAELYQRRYEWLRDRAMYDSSWLDLSNDEFAKRVDQHIAEELQ